MSTPPFGRYGITQWGGTWGHGGHRYGGRTRKRYRQLGPDCAFLLLRLRGTRRTRRKGNGHHSTRGPYAISGLVQLTTTRRHSTSRNTSWTSRNDHTRYIYPYNIFTYGSTGLFLGRFGRGQGRRRQRGKTRNRGPYCYKGLRKIHGLLQGTTSLTGYIGHTFHNERFMNCYTCGNRPCPKRRGARHTQRHCGHYRGQGEQHS